MQIALRRNTQPHPTIRYFVDADLSRFVVQPKEVTIAVHHRPLETPQGIVRELYTADLAGFRLQAGNVNNIVRMVEKMLPALVNYARLPDYVFIARRSQRIYPVYTIGDEVAATTPGGPAFRHVELAKVREYLTDYVVEIGDLGTPGKSEKLHVRGVSRQTLALLRPVFYLKKRIPGQTEFWAPVIEAEDGHNIYAYVASAKREVPIESGQEVLTFQDVCAEALIADNRLFDRYDLRPDRLMPDYWARLKAELSRERLNLAVPAGNDKGSAGTDIPVFSTGKVLVAVEQRPGEERYGLFLGKDITDVRDHLAKDFVRRDLIDSPDAVRIVPVRDETPAGEGERELSLLDRALRHRAFVETA